MLFRRCVRLKEAPIRATGWVSADSRYRLSINGKRVLWGPSPCDPRHLEADPLDIARWLQTGDNAIGCEVLYYGWGDGTWCAGKPGLIFSLRIEYKDGACEHVYSDTSWRVMLDRAHPPGQYKRFFLRSLQEVFDARLRPADWDRPPFEQDDHWLEPLVLSAPADKPPVCSTYKDYLFDGWAVNEDEFRLERGEITRSLFHILPLHRHG